VTDPQFPKPVIRCIQSVADDLSADVLLFSAEIAYESVNSFIEVVRNVKERNENVALILSTNGGDPDAAYRMTRILKERYKKFILLVFGYCKSAGTLIALGADEIVMSDFAELGPLDIQIYRDDDFRTSSGLDLQQALNVLNNQIFDVFETCLLKTIDKGGGIITTKTASDIASSMAVGLLAPISSQIDPLRLGEMNRLMSIAYEYGKRLNPAKLDTIRKLVSGYPSHSFVIDYREAQELFETVRRPNANELTLEKLFSEAVRSSGEQSLVVDLTALAGVNSEDEFEGENDEKDTEDNTDSQGTNRGDGQQDGRVQGDGLFPILANETKADQNLK